MRLCVRGVVADDKWAGQRDAGKAWEVLGLIHANDFLKILVLELVKALDY